jgi:prepilin-type processing-associated H-X9-DG protein
MFFKIIKKASEIVDPPPVQASVFLDEDEFSIQNGAIGIEPLHTGMAVHWNLVASRHNYGASLSFADGHAEVWRWLDRWIREGHDVLQKQYQMDPLNANAETPSSKSDRDLQRLQKTVPY